MLIFLFIAIDLLIQESFYLSQEVGQMGMRRFADLTNQRKLKPTHNRKALYGLFGRNSLLFILSYGAMICFFLGSQPVSAQSFKAGILAGVVASQVDGDNLGGFNKAGLTAGLISNVRLNEKWSGQFELLYIQKGSRSPVDTTGLLQYYRLRLQYIEIPVLVNYHYHIKKARAFLEGGFSYGQLIRDVEESNYYSPVLGSGFEKNDVCINLGMGFGLGPKFFFHVRYAYSLIPVRTGTLPGPRTFFGAGQKNNLLVFSMRYYFKPL